MNFNSPRTRKEDPKTTQNCPFFSSSPKKKTEKLSQILLITGKQISSPSSKPQMQKTESVSGLSPKLKGINSSLLFDSTRLKTDEELSKFSNDDLKFNKYFKKNEDKKFIKQGKTIEISSSLVKRQSLATIEPKTNSIHEDKCPYQLQDIKSNWFNNNTSTKTKKQKDSLLDKIGEEKFLEILKSFYSKIFKNSTLYKYFNNNDHEKFSEGVRNFLVKSFNSTTQGNIEAFSVSLQTIHKKLNISHTDYDTFKGIMAITLREFKIDEEIVVEMMKFYEKIRKFIVREKTAFEKVKEIVSLKDLSQRILERTRINSLLNAIFKGWDADKHKKHLEQIYDFLLRDEQTLSNAYLRESHRCLDLSSDVMYHFKQILVMSFRDLKVDEDLIFEMIDKIEMIRSPLLDTHSFYEILFKSNDINSLIKTFVYQVKSIHILSDLFNKHDDESLTLHCKKMLTFCLGGPSDYIGCDMTPAHINHKISKDHYHAMREALQNTLKTTNLQKQEILYILVDLDYYKYDICNEKCLFDKLGSQSNIEFIIQSFYLKAFQHPKLCGFYKNTDPICMIRNQKFFFTKFFQAKKIKSYHFKDLRTFHLEYKMTDEHFDFFVECLASITKELNIEDEKLKKEIIDWIGRTRNDILNKHEE